MPHVSIIVLNWNGLDVLQPCLDAVRQTTGGSDCDVLVYDNGSTETGVRELVEQHFPEFSFHRSDVNHGFAGGNNRAARLTQGQYLVFLNNDTIPQPGWLEALLAQAEKDELTGMVGATILNHDRSIQNAGGYFVSSIRTYGGPYRGYPLTYPGVANVRECEVYIACAILVRRSVFDRVSGFDERYFQGYEDYDICLKVREAGFKIYNCPDAHIVHYAETSTKRLDIRTRRKAKRENTKLFFALWESKIAQFRLPSAMPDEMTPLNYYTKKRDDFFEFIAGPYENVLEVGCGAGVFARTLKDSGKAKSIWGVELDGFAASLAVPRLDGVLAGDFAQLDLAAFPVKFDLVIFADVLEHLPDPWRALDRVNSMLNPDGEVVVSVPNVRHYKIIKKLFKDQWRYEKEGILDRTHLRFFGLSTITDLFNYSGFEIVKIERKRRARAWVARVASILPGLDELITYQYYIHARKNRPLVAR